MDGLKDLAVRLATRDNRCMGIDQLAGLIVGVLTLMYLVYALLRGGDLG